MTHDLFDKSNLISSYTRREMIDNGDLIDVSETAREAGIRYPTALTAAAWQHCVAVPPGVTGQDERGRLYADMIVMPTFAFGAEEIEWLGALHNREDRRPTC